MMDETITIGTLIQITIWSVIVVCAIRMMIDGIVRQHVERVLADSADEPVKEPEFSETEWEKSSPVLQKQKARKAKTEIRYCEPKGNTHDRR